MTQTETKDTVPAFPETDEFQTIRDMCDSFHVTARTLRFYEQKELLFPQREGQKRLYGRRDRARLKLILRGKRFGFSLEEIRQLLELYDLGDQQVTQLRRTHEIAGHHLNELISQRDALNEAIDDLRSQLDLVAGMIAERAQSDQDDTA